MEKKFEFDSAGIEALKVSAASADLQVELVEQGNIVAFVSVSSSDYVPEADKSGSKLHIRFQRGVNIGIPFIKNLFDVQAKVENIRLQVPRNILELDLNNASGDIKLADFELRMLKVNNVSGDTIIESCSATEFNLNTVSGDLSFVASNYRRGKFNSVSGDLTIKGLPPMERETNVSSVSGDVYVSYSGDPKVDAAVSSVSGDINSDIKLIKVEKKHYRTSEGQPQEYLKMSSVSGDLIISTTYGGKPAREVKQKDDGEPVVAKKTEKASSIEENLQDRETNKIVRLYEEGKLTRNYAFEMLSILGYSSVEIEDMLRVDEEARRARKDEESGYEESEDGKMMEAVEEINDKNEWHEPPQVPPSPEAPEQPEPPESPEKKEGDEK